MSYDIKELVTSHFWISEPEFTKIYEILPKSGGGGFLEPTLLPSLLPELSLKVAEGALMSPDIGVSEKEGRKRNRVYYYQLVYDWNHLFCLGSDSETKTENWQKLSADTKTNRNQKVLNCKALYQGVCKNSLYRHSGRWWS